MIYDYFSALKVIKVMMEGNSSLAAQAMGIIQSSSTTSSGDVCKISRI